MRVTMTALSLACLLAPAACAQPSSRSATPDGTETMTQAMPQKKSGFAQRKGGAALQSEAIRIVEGGGFGHRSEQLLSPDDRLVSITRWRGKPEQREDRQLRAGAYLAARRHIEANPIPAGSLGEGSLCNDYGSDIVSVGPLHYEAHCPAAQMASLKESLARIIDSYR